MQIKTLESLLEDANKIIKRLSYDETLEMLSAAESVIIDVREESEVQASGLIKGAINIPKSLFDNNFSSNLIESHIDDPDKTKILMYCAVGVRSAFVGLTLVNQGYKNVLNIGGYSEWVSNGGPTN